MEARIFGMADRSEGNIQQMLLHLGKKKVLKGRPRNLSGFAQFIIKGKWSELGRKTGRARRENGVKNEERKSLYRMGGWGDAKK